MAMPIATSAKLCILLPMFKALAVRTLKAASGVLPRLMDWHGTCYASAIHWVWCITLYFKMLDEYNTYELLSNFLLYHLDMHPNVS